MKRINTALGVLAAFGFLFLVVPLIIIIPLAFSSGETLNYPLPGLSMQWVKQVFADPRWRDAFVNSLLIALASAALAVVIGASAAIGFAFMSPARSSLIRAGLLLPIAVPSVVLGLGLYFLMARVGLLSTHLAIIAAHCVISFPLVMVTVGASLDTTDLVVVRAAQSLGARWPMILRDILIPLLKPALVAGFVLAFLTSMDEVIIAMFLAGPEQSTVPRVLFANLRDRLDPSTVAVSALMLLVSAAIGFAIQVSRRPADAKDSAR